MGLFANECANCGVKIERGARFCGACGQLMPTARRKCSHCGAENVGDARFCAACGGTLAERGSSLVWQRDPGAFAQRVDIAGPEMLDRGAVIVEQGTRAMLFVNGRYTQDLEAGKFTIKREEPGRLAQLMAAMGVEQGEKSVKSVVTAILVDGGDCSLEFTIDDLYTADPLKIAVDVNVIVRVEDMARFHNNVMKSRTSYRLEDLKADLEPEIQNALAEMLEKKPVSELNTRLELKREIEANLEHHLKRTFERNGYSFEQVRTANFRHEALDKERRIQETYLIAASEQEARNAGRKRLFDAKSDEELQKIYEVTRKIEINEKRVALRQRLRRALTEDKIGQIDTKEELEKHIDQVDRARLLREEEKKDLIQGFEERREDSGLARDFMLKKLDMERGLDLKRISMIGDAKLNEDVQEIEIRAERARLEAGLANDRARHLQAMEDRARENEQALKEKLASAQTDAEAGEIQLEIEKKRAELGFYCWQRTNELEKQEQQNEIAVKLQERREEMLIAQEAEDRAHQREMERLRLDKDDRQADRDHDIKRLETMRQMEEGQILAAQAGASDAAAQAAAERYRAQAAGDRERQEELKQLYIDTADRAERLAGKAMESTAQAAGGRAESERASADRVERMAEKAIESNAQVAGASAAQGVKCPKCGGPVKPGAKFCQGCGATAG